MHTEFWWGNPKKRSHFDMGVHKTLIYDHISAFDIIT